MDAYEVDECLQGLTILFNNAEELPYYICSDENYPIDKTTVISNVKFSSFRYIIGEAMYLLEQIKDNK